MGEYSNNNAQNVLDRVNNGIAELEALNNGDKSLEKFSRHKTIRWDWLNDKRTYAFRTDTVFEEFSIFDWWADTLSLSQLKQMKKFLETAIKLGFDGYVCFKVGVKYCSHGMWAHKEESTNGYSPDGDVLFHSFRSGENYWDMCIDHTWMHDKYDHTDGYFTVKQIKAELNGEVAV